MSEKYIPAFPYAFEHGEPPQSGFAPGMSLRDYFAAQALLGYMQSCSLHDQPHLWAPKMAEYAYTAADAMLEERAKANSSGETRRGE